MNKVKYIIRLKGKASQVFSKLNIILNDIGLDKTLGELVKEDA